MAIQTPGHCSRVLQLGNQPADGCYALLKNRFPILVKTQGLFQHLSFMTLRSTDHYSQSAPTKALVAETTKLQSLRSHVP